MYVSTLLDIEEAAAALPSEQKEELLVFLAIRLRADRAQKQSQFQLQPRLFSAEKIAGWIEEDEEDMKRLREKPVKAAGEVVPRYERFTGGSGIEHGGIA